MYGKLRIILTLLIIASFCFLNTPAFAAVSMSDEAVLGNQRWSVQNDGDLAPGADSSYDIGESGNEVSNIYADGVTTTSVTTASVTATSDVTFRTTLVATGRVGASTTVYSSATNLAPASLPYSVLRKWVGGAGGIDETDGGTRLQNGTAGQILVLTVIQLEGTGTWIVTPVTCTAFSAVTLNTIGDIVTLLYFDDAIGWVVIGNAGATVTTKA